MTKHPDANRPDACPVIIALTASAFEEERAAALAAGCDDFISKPFHEAEIFAALSRHLHVAFVYEAPQESNPDEINMLRSQEALIAALKKSAHPMAQGISSNRHPGGY